MGALDSKSVLSFREKLSTDDDRQIGVQSVYEDVARDTNRGHTVQATCESFHLAKDAGFKVVSHMMVGPLLSAPSSTNSISI